MHLSPSEIRHTRDLALRVREHIIRMSTNGGCFIGASLSCVEILCVLYQHIVDSEAIRTKREDRDVVLLSKGHDVPALYGLFAELGFLDASRLQNHLKANDNIYWHPNRAIPGVEFHSGSLGHLISVGMGIAYDMQMREQHSRVFVILGDGELNEGSIWEACLVAASRGIRNLYLVVDRNHFQANIQTEELNPLEPLDAKFKAFGLKTFACSGHDVDKLYTEFRRMLQSPGPSVLVADTTRGKGLPSIEARADRWFCNFSTDEVDDLLLELHGQHSASLHSPALHVR